MSTATVNSNVETETVKKEFQSFNTGLVFELNNKKDIFIDSNMLKKYQKDEYNPFRLEKIDLYVYKVTFLNIDGSKKTIMTIIYDMDKSSVDLVLQKKSGADIDYHMLKNYLQKSKLSLKAQTLVNQKTKKVIELNITD